MGMDSDNGPGPTEHGVRAMPSPAGSAAPAAKSRTMAGEPESTHRSSGKASKRAAQPAAAPAGPVAVPISVVPSEASPQESDIRRLTRIIFSDITIYGPEKADKAILQGKFAESYKTEIEEGRKIIRSRFSSNSTAALDTFQRCLDELLEARKKELAAAIAL